MEPTTKEYTRPDIKGWGIDADPENEPTYPMKHYTGDDHKRSNWERPELQPESVEKLHSNERPTLSAAYGTTLPPSGLSGMIRRYAFKHSESRYRHWLPLILADRINVVEGIIDDIAHGKVPNIFAEKGYGAMWKHNKKGVVTRVAVLTGVVVFATMLLGGKKENKKTRNKDWSPANAYGI